MPRLRRSDQSRPGITRIRRGRGFQYLDPFGQPLDDGETLARIRSLVIPPAWADVWICPYPNGHIQAIGYDVAGRKQYLYHPQWRTMRDQLKFRHMIEFAHCLPDLRRQTRQCLMAPDMSRERVLAAAARMLDRGAFRLGSEQYASGKNATFGIATILKSHVRLGPDHTITFDFVAKHQQRQIHTIVDPDIYEILHKLKRRRTGTELLAYKVDGRWVDVKSADINLFLKQVTGADFTAKDFRTWTATVLAAVELATRPDARTATARKREAAAAVKAVAAAIGNTPAVCRSSYIYPRIIDDYLAGTTIASALEELDRDKLGEWEFREAVDAAVLSLIEGEQVRRKVA